MTITVCPHCNAEYRNDEHYIAHRFLELARWFDGCGDFDTAAKYRTKNPTDYLIVNGIIERKQP
jgi:hypothetical protein